MSSKDEDPMEFLNNMRNKLSSLKAVEDDQTALQIATANARERMDRIDALLAEPIRESKPSVPPPGLSADEELAWCKLFIH